MLFNSVYFLLFFVFVYSANFALRKSERSRIVFLLLASYWFYSAWNSYYLILIVFSTLLDFYVAQWIEACSKKSQKKLFLFVSIVANLGILAVFKYYNFFIDSVFILFQEIGVPFQYSSLQVLLPVGISFYTFQSMSYSVDVYRNKIPAEQKFVYFALFVAFFPQLVAGPIVRATDFIPQLRKVFTPNKREFFIGTGLIWFGLVKKVVFADYFARFADGYFSSISELSTWFDLAVGTYSFAFQIYFDFSGYTDVAIGAALLLGFKIPRNFCYPYGAVDFSDFWRRWHISLSTWMRDYIYIPLGGNRNGKKSRNLMTTMLLSGLWHGAAWNFVLWGLLHGIFIVIQEYITQYKSLRCPTIVKQLLIFHLVCVGWILFRIEAISDLRHIVGSHTSLNNSVITIGHLGALILTAVLFIYQCYATENNNIKATYFMLPHLIQTLGHALMLTLVVSLGSFGNPFIYFQF